MKLFFRYVLFIIFLISFENTLAAEAASGVYFPGTYNDFMVAVIPGPGMYVRNDMLFYKGSLEIGVFSNRIRADSTLSMFTNIIKPAYFTTQKILRARYGFGANLPYTTDKLHSNTSGLINSSTIERVNGLSDITLIPVMLDWSLINNQLFILFYENIYLPTGSFKKNRSLNSGHGYTAFDTNIALSWLSKDMSRELSFTLGYILNTKNTDINYKTGHELHLDFLLGQHLSEHVELGLTGYLYDQLTNDSGAGALLGSFKGFAWGLGPAFSYSITLNKTNNISIISKYIHDIKTVRRFNGNEFDLAISAAL